MLHVYLDPCTINSRKVLAGLDAIGTKYEYHFIDYFAGGQKDPDFVKNVNPSATVPAAVDGDLQLTESNAILQYAADLDGESKLYPKDLKQRANINRWLLWEASVWFGSCYVFLIENTVKPELMSAEPDAKKLEEEAPNFAKLASMLDTQLGKTKYVAGNNLSIADISIASCMHLHPYMKIGLEKYPNLQRWIGVIEKEDFWRKTQPAVEEKIVPSKFKGKKVRASFNYTKDLGPQKLTELYFYEDVAAKDIHEPGDDAKELDVHDGWGKAGEFDLDKHGFCLRDFNAGYQGSWEDDEAVRETFYPEVVEFLKKQTGAKRVLVFDHTIRTQKNSGKKLTQETNTSQRTPVALVHCDYTAESGPLRVRQLLPDEAPQLLGNRVAFYNVWKPLHKVEERPLAMCDVTSSPPEDFFKLYLRYRDRTGENYVMKYSDSHKWYYFPEMEADKVIVLKTYESDEQRARFVGHSAIDANSKENPALGMAFSMAKVKWCQGNCVLGKPPSPVPPLATFPTPPVLSSSYRNRQCMCERVSSSSQLPVRCETRRKLNALRLRRRLCSRTTTGFREPPASSLQDPKHDHANGIKTERCMLAVKWSSNPISRMSQESTNVHGKPLSWFEKGAGYQRDGYCRTGPDDKRHLSVAAIMTHAFHQSEFGDDDYKGISAGQKTCISAHDFKACIKEMGPDLGPKIYLSATDKKALDVVSMDELRRYATKEK